MLDATTKRRIDTARDILVGKIPDPKSQVEQITIALIYKFMDDMDLQSEELGGERKYFTGDFAKYSWVHLVRSKLGGHDVLNLYAEGIQRMPENPGIPELFRAIFRNAYLPYRDPETLRAFLKIIDEFEYDHSERLGDAFEYLLLVLGSQGDAGQFRTPRHIIDFITAIVNPQKTDVILDPACGTAGFLISAYKHILRQNSSAPGAEQPLGDLLNHHDREILARNVRGYDISPDMVRLSLVNMYLHDFAHPNIVEYDTLTSEERWNEYADVILANPPFMSPKGGIQPHSRFSIQSKRSEVLFVDYILEHLNPSGRAGIIVPEGIIFQSQTSYKSLRKLLVDETLIAVISLPGGVFNPYSGVKTSILILDKALSKKSDTIGFFQVDNDGFSLGAQRRKGGPNDMTVVLEQIEQYRERIAGGDTGRDLDLSHGLVVEKKRLSESGDYNLTGDRYRTVLSGSSNFPMVALGNEDVFQIESGGTPKSTVPEFWNGGIAWATLVDLPASEMVSEVLSTQRTISKLGLQSSSAKLLPKNSVIVSTRATIGRIGINRVPLATNQGFKNIVISSPNHAIPEYVAHALVKLRPIMESRATGGTFKELSKTQFSQLEIPLPPLDVQRQIVAEIECNQKVIDGARAVVKNYRPQITIDPLWPEVELGEIAELLRGITFGKVDQLHGPTRDSLQVATTKAAQLQGIVEEDLYHIPGKILKDRTKLLRRGDILISTANSLNLLGRTTLVDSAPDKPTTFGAFMSLIRPSDEILPEILLVFLRSQSATDFYQRNAKTTTNISNLSHSDLATLPLPLPPIEAQRRLVVEIEAEQQLINANKDLIDRMQQKIDATISRIWGEPGI